MPPVAVPPPRAGAVGARPASPVRRRGLAGAALAAGIGVAAVRRRMLTPGGGRAAFACGTLVTAGGGWGWALSLIAFFLSGSALSRLRPERKAGLDELWEKGDRRDAAQVWANGGPATVAALARAAGAGPAAGAAFFGSLATSTADTWATEIGVLSPAAPRRITDGRPLPRGASGGVTALGLAASLAGAALLGGLSALLERRPGEPAGAAARRCGVVTLAGLAGSLLDSLLGATVQAAYRCPACEAFTERRVHRCGRPTQLRHGLPWLGNDAVNALSSAAGAAIAVAGHRSWA